MVIYYEKIGIISLIGQRFLSGVVYYWLKSLPLQLLDASLPGLSRYLYKNLDLRQFGWGDTRYLEDSFKSAFVNASENTNLFLKKVADTREKYTDLFGIDFMLILKKYFLAAYLFEKYFRYELFLQYAKENPEDRYIMYIDKDFSQCYTQPIAERCERKNLRTFRRGDYVIAVVGILGSYFIKWRKKVRHPPVSYERSVLCFVTRPDEYYCDREIFGKIDNVFFLMYDTYESTFKDVSGERLIIQKQGFNSSTYKKLRKDTFRYIFMLLTEWSSFVPLGWHAVLLYNNIILARSYTPEGRDNVFIVFEHHDMMKTIRNEFIKKDGNKTIFFPYSYGFALQYYPQEYYAQYDYILSSGKCLEDHFLKADSIHPVFLRTGCLVAHSQFTDISGYETRSRALTDKKMGRIVVTILCPGVCKPTYYSEIKLMELAQRIAKETNAIVFIRQKPFVPEPEYKGFYEKYTNGNESMYLTGMEYELFDFVPVTDLFITTYSTSACEVAMRGGNIFFVDYMKHPDRFIFWDKKISDGILLGGDEAFEKISAWISDRPDGPVRAAHRKAMERFVEYMGYTFPDYDSYKKNLLEQLEKNVFKNMLQAKRV